MLLAFFKFCFRLLGARSRGLDTALAMPRWVSAVGASARRGRPVGWLAACLGAGRQAPPGPTRDAAGQGATQPERRHGDDTAAVTRAGGPQGAASALRLPPQPPWLGGRFKL